MSETRRRADPLRPEAPSAPGWQLDPWGDGERYWDGEVWTRQTRALGAGEAAAPRPPGPRDWEEPQEEADARPMRSGLTRAMIWAFAVVALIALLATLVTTWLPRPQRPAEVQVPQQSASSAEMPLHGPVIHS